MSLLTLLIGEVVKPLAALRRKKQEKGELNKNDYISTIIKTVGFWGAMIILLYAMSKGILSLSEVEGVIDAIKE